MFVKLDMLWICRMVFANVFSSSPPIFFWEHLFDMGPGFFAWFCFVAHLNYMLPNLLKGLDGGGMAYCSTWPYILDAFFFGAFSSSKPTLNRCFGISLCSLWVCSYYTTQCWVYMLAWLAFEKTQVILPFKSFRFEINYWKQIIYIEIPWVLIHESDFMALMEKPYLKNEHRCVSRNMN